VRSSVASARVQLPVGFHLYLTPLNSEHVPREQFVDVSVDGRGGGDVVELEVTQQGVGVDLEGRIGEGGQGPQFGSEGEAVA
jgi:hypothetical protein